MRIYEQLQNALKAIVLTQDELNSFFSSTAFQVDNRYIRSYQAILQKYRFCQCKNIFSSKYYDFRLSFSE